MLPSIFVSHGSPALTLSNNTTNKFLKELPNRFERPKYILVISAHWTTKKLEILTNNNPLVIYDFYNFPKELYEQEYPAKSNKNKEDETIKLLEDHNIRVEKNSKRIGYDHGVWSPLSLMYPKADIPVIQLSLPMTYTAEELVKLGESLITLRKDTLILSSGSMTHNLRTADYNNENAKAHDYALEFRNWVVEKIKNNNISSLINYKEEAPYLKENHPTLEHFLPFFISLGASTRRIGKSLNDVYTYGNQSMDTIIFEE